MEELVAMVYNNYVANHLEIKYIWITDTKTNKGGFILR
jgi:hypothetical protein